jgi:hypothetical protein
LRVLIYSKIITVNSSFDYRTNWRKEVTSDLNQTLDIF